MTPQEAARDAAVFADALARHLLGASSEFAGREEQRACMVAAFAVWPSLCNRLSILEGAAPACREEGYERAAQLAEIMERVAAKREAEAA
jgi:hypothetical protein